MVHPHACDSEALINHANITFVCQVAEFEGQGSLAETHL